MHIHVHACCIASLGTGFLLQEAIWWHNLTFLYDVLALKVVRVTRHCVHDIATSWTTDQLAPRLPSQQHHPPR